MTQIISFEQQVEATFSGTDLLEAKSFDEIRPGDKVTILIHAGGIGKNRQTKPKTGRVVMSGPAGWVLNMGGRHGTPAIATPENTTKINGQPVRESKVESGQLVVMYEASVGSKKSIEANFGRIFVAMGDLERDLETFVSRTKSKDQKDVALGLLRRIAKVRDSRQLSSVDVLLKIRKLKESVDQLARGSLTESPRLAGIEKERGVKLLQRLQRAVHKKLDSLPLAAPIAVQITKSIFAVEKAMQPHLGKKGAEAVNAFTQACVGHFTDGFAVLAGLKKKYRLDSDFRGNIQPILIFTNDVPQRQRDAPGQGRLSFESLDEASRAKRGADGVLKLPDGTPFWRTAQVFAKSAGFGPGAETLLNTLPNLRRPDGKSLSSGGFVTLRPGDDETFVIRLIAKQIRRKPEDLRLAIVGESQPSRTPFADTVENVNDIISSSVHDAIERHKGKEIVFAVSKRDAMKQLLVSMKTKTSDDWPGQRAQEAQRATDGIRVWKLVIGRLNELGYY